MNLLDKRDRNLSATIKLGRENPGNLLQVFLLVTALLFFGSCSSNRATIYIPAEQEFVLGADENQNFRVDLKNTSGLPVAVSAVDKNTETQTQGFRLEAQGSARVFIGRKEKVVLKNSHSEEIRIKARLNKGVAGMSYRPLDQDGQ
ncbi:hypothetical protein [Flavilitoribacter nigricans]|uniref:Uncharacterized protein n=1 Tax=Flavilitoribacter nigricans (strain ATCC 23147 / DSM 23189 / NBRC 102662 / NCIMB 1420 / SS-2) TaxID=1122177 RepID=A0A2D0NC16_FLAN2|nr:hypothetical protein [Flavilitoribacter nigricans]PHN05900.1 hypothetical protein CRP01_13030 [Flavilitoribacter nigricans DSM 23189 = NBRC 102662]